MASDADTHPLIRAARMVDEEALRCIDRATWSPETTPAPRPSDDEPFLGEGRSSADVLVAELDGQVVGYALIGAGFPMPSHAHVGFMRGLAVHPAHQGRGLGRALLEAAVGECGRRGATRVRSNVLATNPSSLAAHRAAGFVEEGRLRGEFVIAGRAVDDVLLAFTFDSPPPPQLPRADS